MKDAWINFTIFLKGILKEPPKKLQRFCIHYTKLEYQQIKVSCTQCTRCNATVPVTFPVGAGTCDFWNWASHSTHLATQKPAKSLAKFQEFVALQTQPEHVA